MARDYLLGQGDRLAKFFGGLEQLPGVGYAAEEFGVSRRLRNAQGIGRTSLGLDADLMQNQRAKFLRGQLQNVLTDQTALINREYGTAGRYFSGQRGGAIQNRASDLSGLYGNMLSKDSLQLYLAERGFAEDRDWRQAQLESGGDDAQSQQMAQMAQILAQIYLGGGGA